MKINITVPHSMKLEAVTQPWENHLSGRQVGEAIQLADEMGFYKALLGEHFMVPGEHLRFTGDYFLHSTVALNYLAGCTQNIKLGSGLTILPLQNPIVQAKAWSTLDWMSDGRAAPMFGVGWMKGEYEALGVSFHRRGEICEEYVQAMIELWTNETPEFSGKYVSFKGAKFSPKPIQNPMPIWFGGDAEPLLKRIARYGCGWQPFQAPPERFPEMLDFIRSQPEYNGRNIAVYFPQEMLNLSASHETTGDDRGLGSWDSTKIIDVCGWLADKGVSETTVPLPPLADFDAYKDRLRWVSEEIISKVKEL